MRSNNRETTVFIVRGGSVTALAGGPLSMADMGPRKSMRVSRIEFIEADNWWCVFDATTGVELANFSNYDEALAWEREWFNHLLSEGSPESCPLIG